MKTIWLAVVLITIGSPAKDGPRAVFLEPDFRFSTVVSGGVIEHDYVLKNEGSETLRVEKADMTSGLRPTKMPASVAPGEQAVLRFQLDTSQASGVLEGEIAVYTNDPSLPEARLTFQGEVVPSIQFFPMPAFYVSAQRGEPKEASIEIINHERDPLEILRAENASAYFSTELETLEPGKHFRLRLKMNPDAPVGNARDTILLVTSSEKHPFLRVGANTLVKERVYSFPVKLDFGSVNPHSFQMQPEAASLLSQTLMVYQVGGKDFQIKAQTDLPFLRLTAVRSKFQDRYQIEVKVIPEKLHSGRADGAIVIATNDAEFPQLVVPVTAFVEGDR